MTDRALAPVVGKTLEVGIVLLLVGALAAGLLGGAVPQYRDVAADRVADRTLAAVTHDVQAALDATAHAPRGTVRVHLDTPATIRGHTYTVRAADGALHVDHPRSTIGTSVALSVPDRTLSLDGAVESDEPAVAVVRWSETSVRVTLRGRG